MKVCGLIALAALAGAAGSALGGVDSANAFNMVYRNFNDYPNSIITPDTAPNQTSHTRIIENMGPVNADNPQKFANRHFAMLSNDGGATNLQMANSQSFKISYSMRINSNIDNDGSGQLWNQQPEGGLWFFNNNTGSMYDNDGGIFVVGNGTVFIGGANQKFSLIGDKVFAKGDLLRMSYEYFAPGVKGALAEYAVHFENVTSGFMKDVSNTFDPGDPNHNGFVGGASVGFRFQHTRNPLLDGPTVNDIEYGDIEIVPSPASLALIGMGGLIAGRRRRA